MLLLLPLILLAQASVHPFFDGDNVHEIRLYLDAPNWYDQLRANFEGKAAPDYMEARFVWGDVGMTALA